MVQVYRHRMLFAPTDPAFVKDPYLAYEDLRSGPAVTVQDGRWLVPRYPDVDALLRDRRLGRSYLHVATHAEMGQPEDQPGLAPFWRVVRSGMLDVEPPDHTRLRRLVSKAFTPRRVEAMRDGVQAQVDALVDPLVGAGEVDLISALAEPLPVAVIADLLGIPEADRHLLRSWSAQICGMYELDPGPQVQATAVRACQEFGDYLVALSRERRERPTDDLLSGLGGVVDQGDRLSEDELVGTCVLLLNAGHEATVGVTGLGWLSLFRNPAELARLRADRSLVPTAVEELMRYDTPLQMFERWVLEDLEVGGVPVPRGTELSLLFGSANRDPEVFDDPGILDVGRRVNPHLSFGVGTHFCLGAVLARLELQTSFETVLRRIPGLEPAGDPVWQSGYVVRGLAALPVHA